MIREAGSNQQLPPTSSIPPSKRYKILSQPHLPLPSPLNLQSSKPLWLAIV